MNQTFHPSHRNRLAIRYNPLLQSVLATVELLFLQQGQLFKPECIYLETNTFAKSFTQELRDITEGLTTVEDVEAVTFPTKP